MTGERGSAPDDRAIEVRDLAVGYGGEPVVSDVDLEVRRGELVGLVGPNGAGKTTLLQAITGLLEPERGRVRLAGDDVRELSSAATSRRVAVVPQGGEPPVAFTVRQVVEMARHPHRSRFEGPTLRDRAHVERALERASIESLADRSIADVSGGERQRALLARALAQDAPVLALDEPTASLDVNHAVETAALVRDLVDDGRAAIAAIHDLELAARFCDRLVLLAGGEVAASGSPTSVLDSGAFETAFDVDAAVEPAPTGGVTVRPLLASEPERRRDGTRGSEPGGRDADGRLGSGDADGRDSSERVPRVHVVGSGHAAARTLQALADAGVAASLGPVPAGDRAAVTARALDADVVESPPLTSVEDDALAGARALAADAEAVACPVGRAPLPEDVLATVCEPAPRAFVVRNADAGSGDAAVDSAGDGCARGSDTVERTARLLAAGTGSATASVVDPGELCERVAALPDEPDEAVAERDRRAGDSGSDAGVRSRLADGSGDSERS